MTSLLLLLACGADPLEHPNLQPPIAMEAAVSIKPAKGRIGMPFEVPVQFSGEALTARRVIVASGGGDDGRGSWDEWIVTPPEGVTDPSVYWEDQRKGLSRSRTDVKPGEVAELTVRLDESVRFPGPGTYAVQLTSVRAHDRLRSKPVKVTVQAGGDLDARAAELAESLKGKKGPKRTQLLVDLALVGAPSAIPLAVEGLSDLATSDLWSLVLHAHPDRKAARSALAKVFSDPDALVPMAALETHAALCYNDEYDWPVRLPEATDGDTRRFNLERKVRDLAMAKCRDESAKALVGALAEKKGAARGSTLATLFRTAVEAQEKPSWMGQISTEAAKSFDLADARTQQTWLTAARYWDALDHSAAAASLARLASGDADRVKDLALVKLNELDPARAKEVARQRYTANTPVFSPDAEDLVAANEPPPEVIDGLVSKVDGTIPARMRLAARFTQPRHLGKWTELAKGAEARTSEQIGAIVAGLLNAGGDASALLALAGPKHRFLVSEAARVTRNRRPLLDAALKGIDVDDGLATIAAGDVIAEYGGDRELRIVVAMVPKLNGHAEMGAMRAICTGRNWMVDSSVIEKIEPTLENQYAATLSGDFDAADKDVIALQAFEKLGQPSMRFSDREYIGEEAIKRKLKMLRPTRGVKFSFDRISAREHHDTYAKMAREVGLNVIDTGK